MIAFQSLQSMALNVLGEITPGSKRNFDEMERLAIGEKDISALTPDAWAATHPDAVRSYRAHERESKAAAKRARRIADERCNEFKLSGANSGQLSLVHFLTLYFLTGVAQLTAYRVLMVWVYDRTESLLIAVLMHASLIVSTTPILLPAMTGAAFLTWFVVFTGALWIVVAAVALANGSQLSGQPIRLRRV